MPTLCPICSTRTNFSTLVTAYTYVCMVTQHCSYVYICIHLFFMLPWLLYFLHSCIPYTGIFSGGKIMANRTCKSYRRGKFWRISYSQCICQIHFSVSVNIDVANSSQFVKFVNFPLPNISCVWYVHITMK